MTSHTSLPAPPLHCPPPGRDYAQGSTLARRAVVASVLGAHVLGAWGLLQLESVRQAVVEVAPLMVNLIALPPAQPTPPTPHVPPAAAPPPPKLARQSPPPPATIAAAPSPTPAPEAFVTPQPAPPVAVADASPSAVQTAPAAQPTPPAPPAPPKTIPATAVQYLEAPAPHYPSASRRLGESGRVLLRVEIDTNGHARQVQLMRSSGSARLDDAAMAAVRVARFKPYTENGAALVVWTTLPIVFELAES